jgi:ribosomal protein S18 acetylase RimI-like enzyme
MRSSHPLDNPVWHAIASAQRSLSEVATRESAAVGCFQSDVSPFEELLMGQTVALIIEADMVPSNWEIVRAIDGVQLDGTNLRDEVDDSLTVLQAADVPDMLDLVERTQPGPFLPRTIEMGTYVGLHHEGRLVAMAGERLRPPGWTEISAVCTDAAVRHQGIGTRLVRAVAAGVRERGDLPFLHAAATNASAIRLYLSLGFVLRRTVTFTVLRTA